MGVSSSTEYAERIRPLRGSVQMASRPEIEQILASAGDDLLSKYVQELKRSIYSNYDDFHCLGQIGSGGFGRVLLLEHKTSLERCALKIVQKQKGSGWKASCEKRLLLATKFPFVVGALAIAQSPLDIFFFLEFSACGSLKNHLLKSYLNLALIQFWAAQLVLAVEYLHSIDLIHRDIKLENVLVQSNAYIKLNDFDCAVRIQPGTVCIGHCGTRFYQSPEMVSENLSNKASDWWAVGVSVYKLTYSQYPVTFDDAPRGMDEFSIIRKTYQGLKYGIPISRFKRQRFEPDEFREGGPPNEQVNDAAVDFMYKLFRTDPTMRLGGRYPGSVGVRRHPFFKDISFAALYHQQVQAPMELSQLETIKPTRTNCVPRKRYRKEQDMAALARDYQDF